MNIKTVVITVTLILSVTGISSWALATGSASPENINNSTVNNQKGKILNFMLKEAGKTQTLKVRFISDYKIHFTLTIDGPCKKTVSGFAQGAKGDYENEEDEKGEIYPAIAYEYEEENGYVLSMAIAVETVGYKQDKAILLEAEDKSGCPVIVKTMKLVQ